MGQKEIALADFLAELSMRPSSAPVILDDPITSLDARRTDEVAERIVNLSTDHQVIVFTHHLYFATKLLDAFDQSSRHRQCSFYEVLAEDDKVGLVLRGSHPRMDTVKAFTGRIKRAFKDARAASGAARTGSPQRTATCGAGLRRSSRRAAPGISEAPPGEHLHRCPQPRERDRCR